MSRLWVVLLDFFRIYKYFNVTNFLFDNQGRKSRNKLNKVKVNKLCTLIFNKLCNLWHF